MYELKKMGRYLRVNMLGPGPLLWKKNLPGRCLTKVEKHCSTALLIPTRRHSIIINQVANRMLTGKINALNDDIHIEKLLIVKNDEIHIEKLLIVKNDEINVEKASHSKKWWNSYRKASHSKKWWN